MTQINTLISNLTRSVEFLNFDIDEIEARSLVRDLSDPPYTDTSGPDVKISSKLSRRCKPA